MTEWIRKYRSNGIWSIFFRRICNNIGNVKKVDSHCVSNSTCLLMNAVAIAPCSLHCSLMAESSSLYVFMS